jgi:hypothetical protein
MPMSLKSIDLQLSVTRSLEAGQIQSQMAHKPIGDQAAAAQQAMRQQELERSRSARSEKPSEGKIRAGDNSGRGGTGASGGRADDGGGQAKDHSKPREAAHPYKGKFIDLTL